MGEELQSHGEGPFPVGVTGKCCLREGIVKWEWLVRKRNMPLVSAVAVVSLEGGA